MGEHDIAQAGSSPRGDGAFDEVDVAGEEVAGVLRGQRLVRACGERGGGKGPRIRFRWCSPMSLLRCS